ncbi:autotransporter domain-containing protein [Termitidicoccus mucosus]|uniref:Autotransporter domain-containing protein n=1 Tax=Termitidicoccus mucosus TaxID=1184151 RepID=A0A178ILB5_9BACT|nr:hypothetical protein AW736_09985 [Opitutaceae bacterium TSB47]
MNIKDGFSTSISIDAVGYSLTDLAFSALTNSADVTITLGLYDGTTIVPLGVEKLVSGDSMTQYIMDLSTLGLGNAQIDLVMTYTAPDGTLLTLDNIQIVGVTYDPAQGLMVVWQGGDGTWGVAPANTLWTNAGGTATGAWMGGFATFGGTAGTVTVSNEGGPVTFAGAEFLTSGYVVTGGELTTETETIELRVAADATATIASKITGTGGLDKTEAGTLILSGSSDYSGATTVSAGMLLINGDQTGATGAVSVTAGATLGGTGVTGGHVTIADGGTLLGQSGATFTLGGLTLNENARIGATLGAPDTTGSLPLFQINGDLTLDGWLDLANAGSFGPGLYRLFNYTGTLTDRGLEFGAIPSGVSAAELEVQSDTAGKQVNLAFAALARNFWIGGSGTWSADSAGGNWTAIGGVSPGAWETGLAIFQGTPGTVTVDATAGEVSFTDMQFFVDGYTLAGDALTVTGSDGMAVIRVGDGTAAGKDFSATIASILTGASGIKKDDLGTLILSGSSTYAGATQVSAGTLRIDGDQSGATGTVTVASGGKLGGAGTTGGAVTVKAGGILLGQSGQTLAMAGLTLEDGATIQASLGAPGGNTLFQVNGDLSLDGTLNVTDAGSFGIGLYRLITYTGSLVKNELVLGLLPTGVNPNDLSLDATEAGRINLLYLDGVTPLPRWIGGSGTWSVAHTPANWGDGTLEGGWRPGFALFQGEAGTVMVDTTAGAVEVTGIQFASDGYLVTGGALTTHTATTTIRVGDGTEASAGHRATIASAIVGTGGIEKSDYGTLILSGTNSYSGGTIITRGVLEISGNANLGAAGGGLALNGGTLRTTAGFSSARAVTLGANGGVLDTGANDLTLTGAIGGAGNLYKTGAGLLTLSGANTFTGTTSIAQGGIALNASSLAATVIGPGARLTGSGTIRGQLANHGVLSPGASPGAFTVEGDFVQSAAGAYHVELASASSYDRLTVNGSASLAGNLIVTGLGEFVPQAGQTFTILTAAGGVTGEFDTVISDWDALSAMLRFEAAYGGNAVIISLAQLSFAGIEGATTNQIALGQTLDAGIAAGNLATLRTALNSIPTQARVLAALNQLSPQSYERWFQQAVYSAGATVRAAEGRLAGTDARSEGGLWFELTRRETRFDATADLAKAETTADGVVVGGDTPAGESLQLGVLFSYTDEDMELDQAGGATDIERFSVLLYGRYRLAPVFFEAAVGGSYSDLASRRAIALPTYAAVAEGETHGRELIASLRAGYPLTLGALRLVPYSGLQYIDWSADAMDEEGAGDASLSLRRQSGESLASRLGVNLSWSHAGRGVTLIPRVDVAWRHEFKDDPLEIKAALGGAALTVLGRTPGSDGFQAALGLDAVFGRGLAAYLRFSGEWDTAASEALEVRGGVEFRF